MAVEGLTNLYTSVPFDFVAGPSLGKTTREGSFRMSAKEAVDFEGPEICCQDHVDGCGEAICHTFPETATRLARLEFELVGGEAEEAVPPDHERQFESWAVFSDENGVEYDDGLSSIYREFPSDGRTVCVKLMSRHIPSGTEQVRMDDCIDLGSIEPVDVEARRAEEVIESLGRCTDPGDHEELWCEIFEEPRRTGKCGGFARDACEEAIVRCASLMDQGAAMGGSSSDSDLMQTPAEDDSGHATSKGGCSLAVPTPASPQTLIAALASLAFLARRRRKNG
jgi:MYXO-CTERM domain-containing protein